MENINKTECLENAYDKLGKDSIPHYGETMFACDRMVNDIDDDDMTKSLPIVKNYRDVQVLRFKNLMKHYYWFHNAFLESCIYYRYCNIRGENWSNVSDTYKGTLPFDISGITDNTIFGELPDEISSGFSYGDVICVTTLYDELIRRYNTYANAKNIYDLTIQLIDNEEYSTFGEGDEIPYLNISLYLEQECIDEGIMTPYIEYWIPGKKYYLGDVVLFSIDGKEENAQSYVLTNCDLVDEFGQAYFNGYVDKVTGLLYFDTMIDDKIIYNHWQLTNTSTGTTTHRMIQMQSDSELITFKRLNRHQSDKDGRLLPFILHYNLTPPPVERVMDKVNTEFFYMCGFVNSKLLENGSIQSNLMEEIKFYDNTEGSTNIPVVYDYVNNNNTPIVTNNNMLDNCNTVRFTYRVGCLVTYDNAHNVFNVIPNTGVKYTEEHTMSIKTMEVPMLIYQNDMEIEEICNFRYIELAKYNELPTLEFSSEQIDADNWVKVPIFKNDRLMHIQNNVQELDGTMNRGRNAAFERHNALGEISTMQDLEHYRNDYFSITK